jgi:putative SOS response-associated peptidase YedK
VAYAILALRRGAARTLCTTDTGARPRWTNEARRFARVRVGRAVSLITTEPNELMRTIHDGMPVIIPTADYSAWLDPANQDTDRLKGFIRSFPADLMKAYPVSARVSNARNEGKELIEPVEA